ncbi:ParB N-terminal domain-containing protein [bacterium]|nr:ParB N-terminal domain-containing protein [bacterium]
MFHLRDLIQKNESQALPGRIKTLKNPGRLHVTWQGPVSIELKKIDSQTEQLWLQKNMLFRQHVVQSLQKSIRAIGLSTPLYLMPGPRERYAIMSGFTRFQALHRCRKRTCSAYILATQEVDAIALLSFWIQENTAHRNLTIFEKAYAIDLFTALGLNYAMINQTCAHMVGLPPHPESIKRYHQILLLSKKILQSLIQGELTETQAILLAPLSPRDRTSMYHLLMATRANNKETDAILKLLSELALIERKSLTNILAVEALQCILTHARMNKREKTVALLSELKKRRYPLLTSHEQAFRMIIKKAHIPPGLSIQPPPSFEGDALRIMFSPRSTLEIKQMLQKLEQMLDDSSFSEILKLL